MHRIFTPFVTVTLAATVFSTVALADNAPESIARALCERVTHLDIAYMDQATPPAAGQTGKACEESSEPAATVGKIENVPLAAGATKLAELGPERPLPSAGTAELLPDARRAVRRDMPNANARVKSGHDDEWVRLSEGPMPEPGAWAVLLAGILGIFAVARPRIFSS